MLESTQNSPGHLLKSGQRFSISHVLTFPSSPRRGPFVLFSYDSTQGVRAVPHRALIEHSTPAVSALRRFSTGLAEKGSARAHTHVDTHKRTHACASMHVCSYAPGDSDVID